jgi:hypothetical protein
MTRSDSSSQDLHQAATAQQRGDEHWGAAAKTDKRRNSPKQQKLQKQGLEHTSRWRVSAANCCNSRMRCSCVESLRVSSSALLAACQEEEK